MGANDIFSRQSDLFWMVEGENVMTGFRGGLVARGNIRWVMENSGPAIENGAYPRFEGMTEENGSLESFGFTTIEDAVRWMEAEPIQPPSKSA